MNVDGGVHDGCPPTAASPSLARMGLDLELDGTVVRDRRPRDRDSHRVNAGTADRLVQQDRGFASVRVAVVVAFMPRRVRARHSRLKRCRDYPEHNERRYEPHD